MMKRLKRLLTAAVSGVMIAGAMSVSPVSAATIFVQKEEITASDNKKITVTVLDTDQYTTAGTGAANDEISGTGVEDVTVNALKIGNVVQLTTKTDAGTKTEVAYELSNVNVHPSGDTANKSVITLLGLEENLAIVSDGAYCYFAPETVQTALSNLTADGASEYADLEQYVANAASLKTSTTNQNGTAEFSVTDSGLYVITEGSLPSHASTDFLPFLVSVPMYVNNSWTNSVYAYPKVRTSAITISKSVSDLTQIKDNDYAVEKDNTANFTLNVTIPQKKSGNASAENLQELVITDINSNGTLNVNISGIQVSYSVGNSLTSNTDFTINDDIPGQFLIRFTYDGLKKINTARDNSDVTLTITYSASIDTVSYSNVYTNHAEVTYNFGLTNSDATAKSNDINLYTYGIDLVKTLSDSKDNTSISNVKFKVYDDSSCSNEIKFSGNSGTYWKSAYNTVEDGLSVDNDGKLHLYGIKPGTYYLKETATASGYAVLDKPIEIKITADNKDDTNVTAAAPSATVNGESAAIQGGLVQVSVVNTKLTTGFTLPTTGGAGTFVVTAVGLGLLSLAVVLLAVYRKKNRESEN